MPDSNRQSRGWLCAFGVVLIWSGWLAVSRLGVIQSLTIYDMMMLRFSVAVVATAPFIWKFWPRQLRLWQLILLSFGQGMPYLGLSFGGMQYAPTSHAGTLMNGTLPFFAAVVGWLWLKDRPDGWRILGMIVLLGGCALIGWDRQTAGVSDDAWIGHLMFLAAAMLVAVNMVGTKLWGLTPMQAMVCIPLTNLVWYGPIYLFALPKAITTAPLPEVLLQGAYQGLGPSIAAVLMFTTAIRTIGPSATAAMMALVPGMAALLAIPILSEWPSELAWGGLIITTAGILLAAGVRPGKASPKAAVG